MGHEVNYLATAVIEINIALGIVTLLECEDISLRDDSEGGERFCCAYNGGQRLFF